MENKLYIVHEKLKKIPIIDEHTKVVDLHRNDISNMSLSGANSVEYLDLSDNKIATISDLESMPNLKILDLSYNLITDVCIPQIDIEELYLISNDIAKIKKLNLPRIRKLDMAVNSIDRIENLEGCSTLEELYLGGNKIKALEGLDTLNSLRVLDLQNNEIEVVDCLAIPKQVETLLLGENRRLRSIENIEALKNLRILGLEKTSISRGTIEGDFTVWY